MIPENLFHLLAEHIEELRCDPAENLERWRAFLIELFQQARDNNTEKEQ